MATPWSDMELAVWDFLAADAGYAALGLQEYRGYLGLRIPWDEQEDSYASQALPAFALWADVLAIANPGNSDPTGQMLDNLHLKGRLVYAASPGDRSRGGTIEPAIDAIVARLQSREGRAGMGSPLIHAIEVQGGAMREIMDQSEGRVSIWQWEFELNIWGHPRYAA